MESKPQTYLARLIGLDGVRQVIEFEAVSAEAAWAEANDGIDPLVHGLSVEVVPKPDPQQKLDL